MQVPLDLLTKLLVFVRQEDESDFERITLANGQVILQRITDQDDFQWCYAHNVSTYTLGWKRLAEAGWVELDHDMSGQVDDPNDPPVINLTAPIPLIVRFTQRGLDYAIEANAMPVVHNERTETEKRDRNEDRPGYGMF
jgi:hypothetical protein